MGSESSEGKYWTITNPSALCGSDRRLVGTRRMAVQIICGMMSVWTSSRSSIPAAQFDVYLYLVTLGFEGAEADANLFRSSGSSQRAHHFEIPIAVKLPLRQRDELAYPMTMLVLIRAWMFSTLFWLQRTVCC